MRTDGVRAIHVEFTLVAGATERFMTVMLDHARRSRAEPGCLQFDVCVDPAEPRRVILYELWADHASFLAHGAQPRMAELRAATGPLVEARRLVELDRLVV
jgi:autoinducer 2-degrading protein